MFGAGATQNGDGTGPREPQLAPLRLLSRPRGAAGGTGNARPAGIAAERRLYQLGAAGRSAPGLGQRALGTGSAADPGRGAAAGGAGVGVRPSYRSGPVATAGDGGSRCARTSGESRDREPAGVIANDVCDSQ